MARRKLPAENQKSQEGRKPSTLRGLGPTETRALLTDANE